MNVFLFALLCIASANAFPYNQIQSQATFDNAWFYPDTCCQLEWDFMSKGDPLPPDYVPAGEFMNRNWAYLYVGWKSDQRGEEPNTIGEYPPPWVILTNPNECEIGWYTTRFSGEEIPSDYDKVFPRIFSDSNGDFAKYQGAPAQAHGNGLGIFSMTSLTQQELLPSIQNFEVLYVDCVKSILSMSAATLYNITYDTGDIDKLKSNPGHVIYTKKMMVNNSPVESKSTIKFQIETFDNASMRLGSSHHSFFSTSEQTYREWALGGKAGVKINGLFKFLGFEASGSASGGITNKKWTSSESGNADASAVEIFRTSARRELFEFSQEVTIPPFSKSTLVAFSKPSQGTIPFTAVYELFPSGSHSAEVLESTLKNYGMEEKMERTNRGTLLVSYDGLMDVDAGHEVDVDIQTVKLGTSNMF